MVFATPSTSLYAQGKSATRTWFITPPSGRMRTASAACDARGMRWLVGWHRSSAGERLQICFRSSPADAPRARKWAEAHPLDPDEMSDHPIPFPEDDSVEVRSHPAQPAACASKAAW